MIRTQKWVGLVLVGAGLAQSVAIALDALPGSVPVPKDNPQSAAKIELGKQLYFDPRLSKTGTVSCNSCHNVMLGGEDNRSVSVGIDGKKGGRSSPTVWNAAFLSVQFWDGRARRVAGGIAPPGSHRSGLADFPHPARQAWSSLGQTL